MGVIGRPHGVRGLSHVHSYTADPADLPEYGPFTDDRGRRLALSWASDGVARVVELVDGREVATDGHRKVVDTAFVGGAGMVLRPDIVDAALGLVAD